MSPFAPSTLRWLLCLLLSLSLVSPVFAQTTGSRPASRNPASAQANPAYVAQAREMIDAVLAEPEFDRTQTIKVPVLKSKEPATKEATTGKKKNFLEAFIDWLLKRLSDNSQSGNTKSGNTKSKPGGDNSSDLGQLFAKSGEIVLWLLAFGLIVLLLAYSKHWLPLLGLRRSRNKPLPLSQQSNSALETAVPLPEDIATAVERCWKESKKDEALSLLYRGTIELMKKRHRIDLPQGATEREMRWLVGNAMPSFKDDFGNIVLAWLHLAYAHRLPADIVDLLAGFGRLRQAGEAAS